MPHSWTAGPAGARAWCGSMAAGPEVQCFGVGQRNYLQRAVELHCGMNGHTGAILDPCANPLLMNFKFTSDGYPAHAMLCGFPPSHCRYTTSPDLIFRSPSRKGRIVSAAESTAQFSLPQLQHTPVASRECTYQQEKEHMAMQCRSAGSYAIL